jgi:hypothetical protein
MVNIARLLRGTLVWLSRAVSGTLVHSASTTSVATLDAVVWGVGPAVSHQLPQLNDIHFPHIRDWLGGRLRRHQPYHSPLRSHLVTQTSFACPSVLHRCW